MIECVNWVCVDGVCVARGCIMIGNDIFESGCNALWRELPLLSTIHIDIAYRCQR